MAQLETIDRFAIIGGIIAVISPFFMVLGYIPYIYLYIPWTVSVFFPFTIIVSLFGGVFTYILALRASGFTTKMPQRAGDDLVIAGAVLLTSGIGSLFNLIQILVGILFLILGVEAKVVFKRIQRARRITGWPYATVATSAGSIWARRLSCRFCGSPLIVQSAISSSHLLEVATCCPLDETHERLQLPLSQLEAWTPTLADRLHRCDECGERTVTLIVVRQTGSSCFLKAYCPNTHPNNRFRKIWIPLYPYIAQTPTVDMGFQRGDHRSPTTSTGSQLVQIGTVPSRSLRGAPSSPSIVQPIPISVSTPPVIHQRRTQRFCSQCGATCDRTDRFCWVCGAPMN
ncbi:MAG: hypothetical protein Q6361_04390 [Candidatus Hermodarchaeota archaeon]|nr:hypothetical protein [Candidatus Hermodarchaeota archaeon]